MELAFILLLSYFDLTILRVVLLPIPAHPSSERDGTSFYLIVVLLLPDYF